MIDMEKFYKKESYIFIFKCGNQKCGLEFSIFSWEKDWNENFKAFCPECGGREHVFLQRKFVKRAICEIVYDQYLGQSFTIEIDE